MNPGYAKSGCFYHETTEECKRPRLWINVAPGIDVMLCRRARWDFDRKVKERAGELRRDILAGRL